MREKGRNTRKHRTKNQPSPRDSIETPTDRYTTCWEDIAELTIDSIQPCPIIPDFKTPTLSTQPIVVLTPEAFFCIDGWQHIEQAQADGQSTIRCHIYRIAHHSIIELAIRKTAIRVMPQGGNCSYAESVRNTHRLYQALIRRTSEDPVLFVHGGDRRSVAFTDSKEKNIVNVLASRLGKSPTTISKYLQHGKGLNDAAMEELVNAGAPKLFFEAFQVQKKIVTTTLETKREGEATIVAAISNLIPTWLNEFQQASISGDSPTENRQRTRADQSSDSEVVPANEDELITPVLRTPLEKSGTSETTLFIKPSPTDVEAATAELKVIGEALIEIAASQTLNLGQNAQALKDLITRLCRLVPWVLNAEEKEGGKEGQV